MARTRNPNTPIATRWARHRAQAKFRSEPYDLTCEEYSALWRSVGITDATQKPGRSSESWSMVRIDPHLPWRRDNVQMLTRSQYLQSFRTRYVALGYSQES